MKFEDWFWKTEFEDNILYYDIAKLAWRASKEDMIEKIREWKHDFGYLLPVETKHILESILEETENE